MEVLRGPNIKEFPATKALEDTIQAKALLKVGDNISTDHIMRRRENSSLPFQYFLYLSNFCFTVCDKEFPERRQEGKWHCHRRLQLRTGLFPGATPLWYLCI